ncbi:MAG: hypothetical protein P8016_06905 [Sedimentisphaerales bacterium]
MKTFETAGLLILGILFFVILAGCKSSTMRTESENVRASAVIDTWVMTPAGVYLPQYR